ncbi:Hypothetical predicted protein [Lecanosticta acicola]|uniref:Carboxylic ester hydrolase n=1 Tax=Lecanosticta acicola TaxID=111012 RepID=A0AAI8Z6E9_9PEZI|nr:Hypothetical predicted protein [Lecanosticta acicola]
MTPWLTSIGDGIALVAEAMGLQSVLGASWIPTSTVSASLVHHCSNATLNNLDVFGARILSVDANPVFNHTSYTAKDQGIHLEGTWSNLNFCNVTVTYTHPGRDDYINIYIVLPFEGWTGRFLGVGGGGWMTGSPPDSLAPLTQQGYAAASTDGGHSLYSRSAGDWILHSPGNVNLNLLQDFASAGLDDLAVIGKGITRLFYEKEVRKSYWSGCSTGGRQGLMLAQRYPDAFDGILAVAPAVNWATLLVAEFWPQQVMNRLGYYPSRCELDAITAAAVEACDGMDGVEDGIISFPGRCNFDAGEAVGRQFECKGSKQKVSKEGAEVANAAWRGAVDAAGRYGWYGLTRGTDLAGGLVRTECSNVSSSSCVGSPFSVSEDHIKLLVLKDAEADVSNLSDAAFFQLIRRSVQEYTSIISTNDADLSAFKARGGKMLTWHGLSDALIFPNGSSHYYERVLEADPQAAVFYRYFEAPGVGHCTGGPGPLPADTLDAVVRWVERNEAPEILTARGQDQDGSDVVREICMYPKQQTSLGKTGSDAMNAAGDSSAAYCILHPSDPELTGHAMTFTIGRGNGLVCQAIALLVERINGTTLDPLVADWGKTWRSLVSDSHLRCIGPEKGVIHLALGSLVNAIWDLCAKVLGKPVWRVVAEMSPEDLL